MSGADLEAAVKFVHLKAGIKGWSAFNTKPKRASYLATLVPAWTERVLCAGVAVPSHRGGAPPDPRPCGCSCSPTRDTCPSCCHGLHIDVGGGAPC